MRPVDLMPARTAWPQHPSRIVQVQHPIYAGRTLRWTLAPWRWVWGRHHMIARRLLGGPHGSRPVARVWINGAGEDHEIRFEAHPPRPSGAFSDRRADQEPMHGPQEPIHGANNSYMHVPGLVLTSTSRVCPRGISYFKTSDVLEVMTWMDGLLDLWYPAVPR